MEFKGPLSGRSRDLITFLVLSSPALYKMYEMISFTYNFLCVHIQLYMCTRVRDRIPESNDNYHSFLELMLNVCLEENKYVLKSKTPISSTLFHRPLKGTRPADSNCKTPSSADATVC